MIDDARRIYFSLVLEKEGNFWVKNSSKHSNKQNLHSCKLINTLVAKHRNFELGTGVLSPGRIFEWERLLGKR